MQQPWTLSNQHLARAPFSSASLAPAIVSTSLAAATFASLRHPHRRPRRPHLRRPCHHRQCGKLRHLGTFATPEEAALCCARHVRAAARAAAEAAEARGGGTQPLTADEARAAAAADGLA